MRGFKIVGRLKRRKVRGKVDFRSFYAERFYTLELSQNIHQTSTLSFSSGIFVRYKISNKLKKGVSKYTFDFLGVSFIDYKFLKLPIVLPL